MYHQTSCEFQQHQSIHPPEPSLYHAGDFVGSKFNENLAQVDWAIKILHEYFGPGIKMIVMEYLDFERALLFNSVSNKYDEKNELKIKFKLYKIENVALEQRKMINHQRKELEIMRTKINQMQSKYLDNIKTIQDRSQEKIGEYKVVLNRLSLYLCDKNYTLKIFNFIRQKCLEKKLQKLNKQNINLKQQMKQIKHVNESLILKENETEKDIAYILNSQIDGFKDKTFNYLIEKSIVKNAENLHFKSKVDKAIDTTLLSRRNLPFAKGYFGEERGKERVVISGKPVPIPSTRSRRVKYQTRCCQTLVLEDFVSVKSLSLSSKK